MSTQHVTFHNMNKADAIDFQSMALSATEPGVETLLFTHGFQFDQARVVTCERTENADGTFNIKVGLRDLA